MKLNAKFVVSTAEVQFQFDSAEKAATFQRALARFSARSARKHSGQTGPGDSPCVGSYLNAYPIKEDGSVSDAGLTLGEQPSTLKFVEKKKREPKARKTAEKQSPAKEN